MKVLIATEGSEFSRTAIEKYCRMFGNTTDTETKIIAVYELMIPPTEPFAASADYIQMVDEESRRQANEIIAKAEEQIRENCPALANNLTSKIGGGSPERVIVEEAEDWSADLIIVGSHGYGFWKRAWLGSVSNSIVHHAPCSVLIVREKQ